MRYESGKDQWCPLIFPPVRMFPDTYADSGGYCRQQPVGLSPLRICRTYIRRSGRLLLSHVADQMCTVEVGVGFQG